jgi:hypothetical protein
MTIVCILFSNDFIDIRGFRYLIEEIHTFLINSHYFVCDPLVMTMTNDRA